MAIRNAIPTTFRPWGVCDAIDATNAPDGAMSSLKNLIPSPLTARQFVPRPAATQLTNFSGFTTPAQIEALLEIGSRVYGFVASARFAGKSEPFCYDLSTSAFITLANVTAANCPTTQAATGAWTPPSMAMIANRLMMTHPGYSGANKVGWLDMRSFSIGTLTGTTHTSTLIDALSSNPILAGVSVGDLVAGAGVAADTYVVSLTAASVTLSKATTAGAVGVALTFTSGTRAAPIYGAGNTNTTALTAVATWVAQFNGRAYYAVGNGLQFSDSLAPCQITNATQALTLGDDTAVTVLAGLPLNSQQMGGVVQSLIAFKGAGPYWQVTGDQATSDLRADEVQGSVGTLAPLSIAATPRGTGYIAVDGLRFIDPLTGRCGDPIGGSGGGINAPFLYTLTPSRMAAAYNKNVFRVSLINDRVLGAPTQDYWFHMSAGMWSGPHDFPAANIQACKTGDGDFVFAASGVNAKLFIHTISPSATSTYTENGSAINFLFMPVLLPDNQQDQANQMIESDLGLVLPATQALTVQATDEAGNVLGTLALAGDGNTSGVWGSMVWGTGVWGGQQPPYRQYALEWPVPLVFKQMAFSITGQATYGLTIGNLNAKYQILKYQGAYG